MKAYSSPSKLRRIDLFVFHGNHSQKFFESLERPGLIIFFPSPEPELYFHLMPFIKELIHLPCLDEEVIFLCAAASLHVFQTRHALRLPLLLPLPFGLISLP